MRPAGSIIRTCMTVIAVGFVAKAMAQPLPPPPVPAQNPITEPKRVLGKILFWEEQLSSDNTVACGTCHRPAVGGGTDPRIGIHPGFDNAFGTPDDVFGSPGVAQMDAPRHYIPDAQFGMDPQVTNRATPRNIMSQYAPQLFWDGRAGPQFVNPETGLISIQGPPSAALEAQSVQPILNDTEMSHSGRTWNDVRNKLQAASPMAYASLMPADVANAVAANPTYPQLFQAAFGDPAITAERIAFAIATYERTLVPNQTPWDRTQAGQPNGLTPAQLQGLQTFIGGGRCALCHTGATFTNQSFRTIGLRPPQEDLGRQLVTNNPADRGRFKVPSLRNVGLKPRFMHHGRISTLTDVVNFYRNVGNVQFPDNRDPIIPTIVIGPQQVPNLVEFLQNGLTDARVANEQFPFDRPRLLSEVPLGDVNCDTFVTVADIPLFVLALTDPAAYHDAAEGCSIFSADLNLDGTITVSDIGPFVQAVTQ